MPAPRGESSREFAVLLPMVESDGESRILFMKRPERAEDPYSGQVCFPGGAREPDDASLSECALRETREELGIRPSAVEVFAELDWRRSRVHQRVKPFAGRIRGPLRLVPSPEEVTEVLWLPVERLRPELFEVRGVWRDPTGREHRIWRFDLEGREVWGLTARILRDFLFESPEFARVVRGSSE